MSGNYRPRIAEGVRGDKDTFHYYITSSTISSNKVGIKTLSHRSLDFVGVRS